MTHHCSSLYYNFQLNKKSVGWLFLIAYPPQYEANKIYEKNFTLLSI